MAVHNGMPYIKQAVESILSQTYEGIELIIVNDGSTDDTKNFLDILTDPRIVVVHQSHQGQGVARNIGFKMCKTEFVAIMDADDISLPSRLEKQVFYLLQHAEIGIVGTQIAYISSGQKSGFSPPLPCGHDAIYSYLRHGCHAICNSSVMCRTSIINKIGGYRISTIGEDWDFLLQMGEAAGMANLSEVLFLCRIHPKSENGRILIQVRARQAYACMCAQLRAEDKSEISYDEYKKKIYGSSRLKNVLNFFDVHASNQYRRALAEILDDKLVIGFFRLGFSALCSPQRSIKYILRVANKIGGCYR